MRVEGVDIPTSRFVCDDLRLGISVAKADESEKKPTSTCYVRVRWCFYALSADKDSCSYGVAAGAEAFASSVVSGMEGIVVHVMHLYILATLADAFIVEANRGRRI